MKKNVAALTLADLTRCWRNFRHWATTHPREPYIKEYRHFTRRSWWEIDADGHGSINIEFYPHSNPKD